MKYERVIKIGLKIIIAVLLTVALAIPILNGIIQKRIRQELTNLSPALQVGVSSIYISIFSSSVSLDSLKINFIPYSTQPQNRHILLFTRVSLQGVSFLNFLFSKKLTANNFLLEEGNIQLDQFLLDKKDSAQAKISEEIKRPFKEVLINNVKLTRTTVFSHSHQTDQLLGKGDFALSHVQMNSYDSIFHYEAINCSLSEINYGLPDATDSIHIQKLVMDSRKGTLQIDSIHVGPSNIMTIPAISITGFDVKKLLNDRAFVMKRIKIDKGSIGVMVNEELLDAQMLPSGIKKIHLDSFQFNDVSVSYKDSIKECHFRANINLSDINIKSFDKDGLQVGATQGHLSGIRYSGDNYHDIEIKTLELDSKKQIMQIDSLKIVPQLGKYEFGRKLGHQADRVEANISKIEIIKLQVEKLYRGKLYAGKINIGSSTVHVFRDRRLPRLHKILPLPVAYMKKLPVDLRVESCALAGSTIEYEEYPKEGYGLTGILRIKNADMTLSPLINHPVVSDPAYLIMKVNGSIMGSGTTSGTIKLPLRENKPYLMKGAFKNVDLTKLNPSSENLGKIRIESGFLNFLSFDFTMTEERSTGKIIGAYHHLIIKPLKKHTEEKKVAGVASFMLSHLIIPLDKDESLPEEKRTGKVDYVRDPTRFVSFYFIQSLLQGVNASFTLGFLLPK